MAAQCPNPCPFIGCDWPRFYDASEDRRVQSHKRCKIEFDLFIAGFTLTYDSRTVMIREIYSLCPFVGFELTGEREETRVAIPFRKCARSLQYNKKLYVCVCDIMTISLCFVLGYANTLIFPYFIQHGT